jgi:nucleoside-diphosphate-sugar epimerase
MPKQRVLIAGAAGFLGSHLCDRFIRGGYEVIGMDNLLTGSLSNIEHLLPLHEFCFYHHVIPHFKIVIKNKNINGKKLRTIWMWVISPQRVDKF